jgi:hypothetical protein
VIHFEIFADRRAQHFATTNTPSTTHSSHSPDGHSEREHLIEDLEYRREAASDFLLLEDEIDDQFDWDDVLPRLPAQEALCSRPEQITYHPGLRFPSSCASGQHTPLLRKASSFSYVVHSGQSSVSKTNPHKISDAPPFEQPTYQSIGLIPPVPRLSGSVKIVSHGGKSTYGQTVGDVSTLVDHKLISHYHSYSMQYPFYLGLGCSPNHSPLHTPVGLAVPCYLYFMDLLLAIRKFVR